MTSRSAALSVPILTLILAGPAAADLEIDDWDPDVLPITSRCFTSEGDVRVALSDLAADAFARMRAEGRLSPAANGLRVVARVIDDADPMGRCLTIEVEGFEVFEPRPVVEALPHLPAPLRRDGSTRIAKRDGLALRVSQWVEDEEVLVGEDADREEIQEDSSAVARPTSPIEPADRGAATVDATLEVPPLVFAIAPTRNPTAGDPFLALALPEPSAVRLEMFDVAGRRAWARRYGRLEAGHHRLAVGGERMAAGVYWVRAWQSEKNTLTAKIVVTR